MSSEPENNKPRSGLFLKTFGCQMNVYDSEKVARLLRTQYQLVEKLEDASLVFLNTCSVREKAEHKLYSLLGMVREYKEINPKIMIGVGGCVAQQEGEAMAKRCREIDFIVGTHNLSLIPSLVQNAKEGKGQQIAVDFRDEWEDLPNDFHPIDDVQDAAQLGIEQDMGFSSSVRALVAIQRGCNKMCSFCVVPTTRGVEVSRIPLEVLREVKYKVSAGAREILLLGQTVNSYGRDLSPKTSFAELVQQIAKEPGVQRIRFISPHPQDVRDDLIGLYGAVPQLVPHIHLPLQSGNDRVLRVMNRNYRVKRYLEIVDKLRDKCPNIAITTDVIVGFPTETEAEFEQTLDVMSRVKFAHSFAFKYSRRPNTVAIATYGLEDEIDEDCKNMRLERVLKLQDQHCAQLNREKIGRIMEVLVESTNKNKVGSARGRIPENTLVEIETHEDIDPEDCFSANIPSLVSGPAACNEGGLCHRSCLKPGDLVKVLIKGCGPYGLRGHLAE